MSQFCVQLNRSSPTLTFIIIIILLSVKVQAQFSSDPDDYNFSWIATGDVSARLPTCRYCINAHKGQKTNYFNLTVGLYRCQGVGPNELWAYEETTKSIIVSKVESPLCIDALLWDAAQRLKLLPCNSSVVTQQWTKEGIRLRSVLSDSNGDPLYLWAGYPNGQYKPYYIHHQLVLNSSIPKFLNELLIYTPNFTFLSTTDVVDPSRSSFTTEGLLLIGNSSYNAIGNGDFEESTLNDGGPILESSFAQIAPEYFPLCGWVIDKGPIDYVNTELLQAQSRNSSVHLNTHTGENHWGSISQLFRSEKGRLLTLAFWINAIPLDANITSRPWWTCGGLNYKRALLQVVVYDAVTTDKHWQPLSNGTGFSQIITITPTFSYRFQESWYLSTVNFRPKTNLTRISFTSLNYNISCGPMIDSIEVFPFRERRDILVEIGGSISGLIVIIVILRILLAIKRYKEKKDYLKLLKTEQARYYSYKELRIATRKFSDKNVLGEGGFGKVYRADFPDRTAAAVKMEKSAGPLLDLHEITVLLRVHHRNLVSLLGFGFHKGRQMLVFEYLPNGTLYDRLHPPILDSSEAASMGSPSNVLTWRQRVKIAVDVASGLEYLHHDTNPLTTHRDVKPQNILLTATDSAKIADFGLSRAAPLDATIFKSCRTGVKGSLGYMDPQFMLTGIFSPKSDVYSFGVCRVLIPCDSVIVLSGV